MVAMSLVSRAYKPAADVKDVGSLRTAAIVLGACMIVGSILALLLRHESTTIDPRGVHTSSASGRRSCGWPEISAVDVKVNSTDSDPVIRSIKIRRHRGRSFTLPVPFDREYGDRHDNPDFPDQLAVIRSYWSAHAAPAQHRQP
jgi:hypothetical protein